MTDKSKKFKATALRKRDGFRLQFESDNPKKASDMFMLWVKNSTLTDVRINWARS